MHPVLGFIFILAGGLINPAYAAPLKRTKHWAFENTWAIFSISGMLFVPWIIAWMMVPHLLDVYRQSGLAILWMVFYFGAIWGTANAMNGIGIDLIGISVSGPICAGTSATLGALVPIWTRHAKDLTSMYGAMVISGLVLNLAGVCIISWAGVLRNRARRASGLIAPVADEPAVEMKTAVLDYEPQRSFESPKNISHTRLIVGIVINLIAGFSDPFLNYAFVYGDKIKNQAIAHGAWASSGGDAVWAIVLPGSLVVNLIYCAVAMTWRSTWSRFTAPKISSHWWWGGLMGLIWMFTITLFGHGGDMIGKVGAEVGWPVFYGSGIFAATFWGIGIGEWDNAKGKPLAALFVGVSLMVAAGVFFAYATHIAPTI